MKICVIISLFLYEIAGDELLHPEEKCVPTSTIQGPCHVCVCHTDGVYYCRKTTCQGDNETTDPNTKECEPKQMYRQDLTFCSCSASGHWRSINCRAFNKLLLKQDPIKKNIKTIIPCKPNKLYITDCNICLCNTGVINFDSCTNRPCPKRLKGDYCSPGDVYRSANEFCICSSFNYFIDRLCIKVDRKAIQPISTKEVDTIIDVDKTFPISVETVCKKNVTFTKDCNSCFCSKNKLECTSRKCDGGGISLRSGGIFRKSSLPELNSIHSKCVTGRKYRYKCNTCICNGKGEPICTSMICLQDFKLPPWYLPHVAYVDTVKSSPQKLNSLPDIKEGDPCTPGKFYKMDCNRCQCTDSKELICTKMACLDLNKYVHLDSAKLRQGIIQKGVKKAVLRSDSQFSRKVPEIPELLKGACKPGRVYKKGCKRCFCTYNGKALCSLKKDACTTVEGWPKPVKQPEDLRPPFEKEELTSLKNLDTESQKCIAGRTYSVSCNTCICTEQNNLICTKSLCLSFDDINRVEAYEQSGKKCTDADVPTFPCITCKCLNGLTECMEIGECVTDTFNGLNSTTKPLMMKIDPMKDKCVPNAIYKDNCNRCYCQPDGSLRCTQKTCLNYSQSKMLDEQFINLEKEEK